MKIRILKAAALCVAVLAGHSANALELNIDDASTLEQAPSEQATD